MFSVPLGVIAYGHVLLGPTLLHEQCIITVRRFPKPYEDTPASRHIDG